VVKMRIFCCILFCYDMFIKLRLEDIKICGGLVCGVFFVFVLRVSKKKTKSILSVSFI